MELPPYRIPTWRNTLIHMWEKSVQYLKKMGTIILFASILIWSLNYFPTTNQEIQKIDNEIAQIEKQTTDNNENRELLISNLELQRAAIQSENSYLGKIGHTIEPIVEPLGFDWKMGVSLLTGAAAKEIIVSSLGILYQSDIDADEESEQLIIALKKHKNNNGENSMTPLVAFTFMLFVLLYFPCIAVISAISKEAGWKWATFCVIYTTGLAWLVSFCIYQVGSLF